MIYAHGCIKFSFSSYKGHTSVKHHVETDITVALLPEVMQHQFPALHLQIQIVRPFAIIHTAKLGC